MSRPRTQSTRIVVALAATLTIALPCLATDHTFNTSVGDYSNAANWTPFGVPGVGDHALIVNGPFIPMSVTYDAGVSHQVQHMTVGDFNEFTSIDSLFQVTSLLTMEGNARITAQGTGSNLVVIDATSVTIADVAELRLDEARFVWRNTFEGSSGVISGSGHLDPRYQLAGEVMSFNGIFRPTGSLRLGPFVPTPSTVDIDGVFPFDLLAEIDATAPGCELHVTKTLSDSYSGTITIGPDAAVIFDDGNVSGYAELMAGGGSTATLDVSALSGFGSVLVTSGTGGLGVSSIGPDAWVDLHNSSTLDLLEITSLEGEVMLTDGGSISGQRLIIEPGGKIDVLAGGFFPLATIDNAIEIRGTGQISVPPPKSLLLNGPLVLDGAGGSPEIAGGGFVRIDGSITVESSSTIDTNTFDWDGLEGGSPPVTTLEPNARLNVYTVNIDNPADDGYDGTVILGNNSHLSVVTTAGEWILDGDLDATNAFLSGDDFVANGSVRGAIDMGSISHFENNGFVGPADDGSIGGAITLFVGEYEQGPSATLRVDIGGPTLDDFNRIMTGNPFAYNGVVRLNGRLEARLVNGFQPAINDEFMIIATNTMFGAFTDVDAPGFEIEYTYGGPFLPTSNATLRYVGFAPADIDQNGSVGFTDLVTLLAAWGTCPASCPEDLDGDGSVSFVDLSTLLGAWSA